MWLLLIQNGSEHRYVYVCLVGALHIDIKAVVQRTSPVSYTGLIFFPFAAHKSSRSPVPKTDVQSRYNSRKWEEALISQDGIVGRRDSVGDKVSGSFLNGSFRGRSPVLMIH